VARIHIPAKEEIRTRGRTLELEYGIKPKDALHLACAIEARCDAFLTTDRPLLKKVRSLAEIATLNPIDYVLTMDETP